MAPVWPVSAARAARLSGRLERRTEVPPRPRGVRYGCAVCDVFKGLAEAIEAGLAQASYADLISPHALGGILTPVAAPLWGDMILRDHGGP